MEEVAGTIFKDSLLNKSLQPPFIAFYDFETIIIETDSQSKLGELRKNENESFTVKTC